MIRVFLAVELSPALRSEVATVQQDLRRRLGPAMTRGVRVTWPQPASIHLTLKVLGDMETRLIDPLYAALTPVVGGRTIVSVPLERLGVSPHLQRPRALWVGPSESWEAGEEARQVAGLQSAAEAVCESLGFPRETKPFTPHLTLARIKIGEGQVGVALARSGLLQRPCTPGPLAMESVALMQSELKPTGSVYTKLWEVRLSRHDG